MSSEDVFQTPRKRARRKRQLGKQNEKPLKPAYVKDGRSVKVKQTLGELTKHASHASVADADRERSKS